MFSIGDKVRQKQHRHPYVGLTTAEVGVVVAITNVTGTRELIDVRFPDSVEEYPFYTTELEAVHDNAGS